MHHLSFLNFPTLLHNSFWCGFHVHINQPKLREQLVNDLVDFLANGNTLSLKTCILSYLDDLSHLIPINNQDKDLCERDCICCWNVCQGWLIGIIWKMRLGFKPTKCLVENGLFCPVENLRTHWHGHDIALQSPRTFSENVFGPKVIWGQM